MSTPVNWIVSTMIALLALGGAAPAVGAIERVEAAPLSAPGIAKDCVAKNDPEDIAMSFIERCRKGGIHREFPGTHYSQRLGDIQRGQSKADKTAWKLLNDRRSMK